MLQRIAEVLTGKAPAAPRRDALAETVERAEAATREAVAAINESRRRRGESPLDPSWEQMFGVVPEDHACNGNGRRR